MMNALRRMWQCLWNVKHPPDRSLALELVKPSTFQVLPPLEQRTLADEFEPGREAKCVVFEHGLELVFVYVFGILDFVGVRLEIDVCLDEEDVVD